MRRHLLALCALPLFALPLLAALQQPDWTVSLRTIGPLRVGMTVAQARRAAPGMLTTGAVQANCGVLSTRDEQVHLFTRAGRIEIMRVYGNPRIRTRSGIHIGSTPQEVMDAYRGQIMEAQGSEGVPTLVYVPRDAQDSLYRLVFVLEDDLVSAIFVGSLPHIMELGESSPCYNGG